MQVLLALCVLFTFLSQSVGQSYPTYYLFNNENCTFDSLGRVILDRRGSAPFAAFGLPIGSPSLNFTNVSPKFPHACMNYLDVIPLDDFEGLPGLLTQSVSGFYVTLADESYNSAIGLWVQSDLYYQIPSLTNCTNPNGFPAFASTWTTLLTHCFATANAFAPDVQRSYHASVALSYSGLTVTVLADDCSQTCGADTCAEPGCPFAGPPYECPYSGQPADCGCGFPCQPCVNSVNNAPIGTCVPFPLAPTQVALKNYIVI